MGGMPHLLVAPYLVVTTPVALGPWELVPFETLIGGRGEDGRAYVDPELTGPVTRLVDAYQLEQTTARLGAVVVPRGGCVGDPFERSMLPRLRRALLAGTIANNPRMATDDEERSANARNTAATAENAALWGHPLGDGQSYVIASGVLVRGIGLHHASLEEALPKISPPVELPIPLFGKFDEEVADAAHALLSADEAAARRFTRALDWYEIVFSNSETVSMPVRVTAARSAVEVLTGQPADSKKIVRAYGKLMREDDTPTRQYNDSDVFWAKGPVQLTDDEWWMSRLSDLRNRIVHGDEIPPEQWEHDGNPQLRQIHDRLIALLKRVVSDHAGDPLLRLTVSDRVMPRIAGEFSARLRELDG